MSHRTSSFALACFLILLSTTQGQTDGKYGQFAPPDAFEDDSGLAYYGSENEWDRRQFSQKKADAGYKRRGQRQLLAILNGQEEEALRLAGLRLDQDPQDLEAMFTRTAAYCRLGRLDDALESMSAAVDAGLPVERFLAGPRDLLAPLTNHPKFQELARKQTTGLIHGPMLGALTHRSARVWVRTHVSATVQIPVYKADEQHRPTGGEVVRAEAKSDPQTDFTAVVSIEGLEPSTRYVYDVLINESSVLRTKSLPAITTFPTDPRHQTLRFAFGGGAGFTPAHERIWDTIADQEPDALLLLGDNVYIDLPEKPRGLHQYTYYRRQSRPEFRRLVSSTPVFAIWDDHDCALDDVWMGPYLDRPSWKPDMLRVFRENWVNPAYGNDAAPGCWFSSTLAGIDFFFLDNRYYRTNPFGKTPTMLGPVQKAWLLEELAKSQAPVKVVVSSVPWAPESKPGSRDTWDGFRDEREEIFRWIESQRIEGVLLISADRHRSEVRKIDRPDGYPLYDLMSSRLTNMHFHECLPGALFCYNEDCSFGLVTIDLTRNEPKITYEIINIDGQTMHTLEIPVAELRLN